MDTGTVVAPPSEILDRISLPEKWCIKVEVRKASLSQQHTCFYWPYSVYVWRSNMNKRGWSADGYINQDGIWSASRPRDAKTERYLIELTVEQFENWIINKRKFRLWKLKK